MRRFLIVLALTGCGGGGPPRPAPIANLAATTRSSEVGIPAIDTAVFQRLVDRRDWTRVIDPAVGVVELSAVSTPVDDDDGEFWVRRRCGDHAAAAVETVAAAMQKRAIEDHDGYPVACQAVGTYVECGQPGLGEYDLVYSFRFELRTGGYVLTGLVTYDVGTVAGDVEPQYDAELAKTAAC